MRTHRDWRRILTLWLACQLLLGSLTTLAQARPLWSSFLSVLTTPACADPGQDPGEAPARQHPPLCILCAALGGPALIEPPQPAPLCPPAIARIEAGWPPAPAAAASRAQAAQGCRGPPAAA